MTSAEFYRDTSGRDSGICCLCAGTVKRKDTWIHVKDKNPTSGTYDGYMLCLPCGTAYQRALEAVEE